MHCFKFTTFFLFLSSLFIHANSLAEIICEELPHDVCAFSISSSGRRCLLETAVEKDDEVKYRCRTSEVVVERMAGYLESDKCVHACGVDRLSLGITSDDLLDPQFTNKLCSPACCHHCPNIVDLFFNLAAGEGVFLPDLCTAQRKNSRRSMVEFMAESKKASRPKSGVTSDLASSSEEDPRLDEDSDLTPSSEEAPVPSSNEDSDLAPDFSVTLSPISSEGSTPAQTPQLLGDLGSAVGSVFAPVPSPLLEDSDSTSNSAPTPNLLGGLGSAFAPAPSPPLDDSTSTSNSAPTPNLLGGLGSDFAPAPSPLLEDSDSTSNSAPTPNLLGGSGSTEGPVGDINSTPPAPPSKDSNLSAILSTPLGDLILTPTLPPLEDIPKILTPTLPPLKDIPSIPLKDIPSILSPILPPLKDIPSMLNPALPPLKDIPSILIPSLAP